MSAVESGGVSLAELVATISLGTDLGLGQPMEHVIRETLVSSRIATLLGFDAAQRTETYYSGLLAWVGCHTDAYEQAKWFGDDIAVKRDSYRYDAARPAQAIAFALRSLGAGQSPLARARLYAMAPFAARQGALVDLGAHWATADELALRLGLGPGVRQSLKESFERWDGKGAFGAVGDDIRLTSRVVSLADVVAVHHAAGGVRAAHQVARARSGTQLDPTLVELFCDHEDELLDGLDRASNWDEVIAAEPSLRGRLTDDELDVALEAMGDFSDLKSPYTLGHSRSVADLAGTAAQTMGLDEHRCRDVRRTGWVHDLGRLGVPNSIWDKAGPLTTSEFERVRLHPYLTERMLASAPGLAPLGAIAIQHHERLDGSGYPRGLRAGAIDTEGRILGAADCYATLIEPRPHRPALSQEEAATVMRRHVSEGRLDPDATTSVLQAAGHRTPRRRAWPAGLTAREVDVLRLLARGHSNRQIAEELSISRRTAGSHVEHIYTKIGVRNRAGAGFFATKHGLMSDF